MSETSSPHESASWNIVGRHWRGELGLGVSYWVCGFLIANVVMFVLIAALAALHPTYDPRVSFVLLLLSALVLWTIVLWSLVGIWRSANAHVRRTKRVFWARAAQAVTVLSLVSTAATYAKDVHPALAFYARLAFKADPIGTFSIHALQGGKEIELYGQIVFGVADAVQRALNENPDAHTLHLNSEGGRIGEALKLARLIEGQGLVTYSGIQCASACTIAFAAGRRRLVGPNAQLGFHKPALAEASPEEVARTIGEIETFLLGKGIDRGFIRRGFAVPNETMWYPTTEELLKARVATAVAAPGQFAPSEGMMADTGGFDAEIARYPHFKAFHDFAPETYEELRSEFLAAMREGRSRDEFKTKAVPLVTRAIWSRLPRASDAAVRETARLMIAQARAVKAKWGEDCFDYMSKAAGFYFSFGDFGAELAQLAQNRIDFGILHD